MWDSSYSNMCNNWYIQASVSSLFSKVTPVFSTQGSWFTESWHAFEGGWDELSNLGQEDVRSSRLGSVCRVHWRSVLGCGQGLATFTGAGRCGNLADTRLSVLGS